MKVLAINGSPSATNGRTWWVLSRFIDGMKEAGAEVTTINLAGKKIHHCTGELACWLKTPGKCIHNDDMNEILPLFQGADAVALATPVYVDGMTGLLKNSIDRLVPIAEPFFEVRDGHTRHPKRNGGPSKVALVSVCGFPEMDNFDPLVHHIQAICRNLNAAFAGSVLRPGAPGIDAAGIFHPFKIRKVSEAIKTAGMEFVRDGKISDETAKAVATDLFTIEEYRDGANREFEKALKKLKEKNQ
jgi:multimeric flavodoxin WrbA